MFRWARFSRLGPAFDEFAASGDWAGGGAGRGRRRRAGRDRRWSRSARTARSARAPARPGRSSPARPCQVDVVLDSAHRHRPGRRGRRRTRCRCRQAGPGCRPSTPPARSPVTCGPARCTVDATVPAAAATLRLTSPHGARWSVTDATGGAWFADGVPRQVGRRRPAVLPHRSRSRGAARAGRPAARRRRPRARVRAAGVRRRAGRRASTVTVDYDPARRFDPAADGWYGADLHVHLNYSGDHVLEPADAVRMQRGEGLALMHLTAGNLGGALVYDQELLETTAGTDLRGRRRAGPLGAGVPQPAARARARAGPDRRPRAAVHRRRGHRPPVGLAAEQRGLRADARSRRGHHLRAPGVRAGRRRRTTCSARSAWSRRASWWPTPRSALVDAVELVSCFDDRGALVLYHHLLSCGLRLAATAGTDTFLSFARGPAPASNPPGWGRVYAELGDAPLTHRRVRRPRSGPGARSSPTARG